MFLKNKYLKWYYNIISHAIERVHILGYVEKHHIIPKSIGGMNDKTNLVILTAKEHFICHLLLTKFTIGKNKNKMIYAFHRLIYSKNKNMDRHKINGNTYEYLRKINSQLRSLAMTGKKHSEETKKKISIAKMNKPGPNKGKKMSNETKHKMSLSKLGNKLSIETKQKLSAALVGHKAYPKQQEAARHTCLNILSKINIGKKRSDKTKKLLSERLIGRKITWNDKISKTRKERLKTGEIVPPNKILEWKIISPTGNTIIVTNLMQFCEQNNLPFNTMRLLKDRGIGKRGPCADWQVIV